MVLVFADERYTERIKTECLSVGQSVFVIEGIRYTPQMSALWKRMKQDGRAGITFDLYDLGIIFFDKTKIKQDYIVNF